MKLKKYKIKKGKKNFRPLEPWRPHWNVRGFKFEIIFDESCWWDLEKDYQGDKDYFDWHKLCGVTAAFGRNNYRTAYIAFKPAQGQENTMLLTGYTNDKKGDWEYGNEAIKAIPVQCGVKAYGDAYFMTHSELGHQMVSYEINVQGENEQLICKHDFDFPWHGFFRQTGTSFGGANNSPGPYGDRAIQDMKLYLGFKCL